VGQSGFPHEGQSSVPTDLSGVVSIDAAANSSAAVLADGSVRFWGRYWGWPKDAPDLRQLAVGTDHRIALWQDGSFSCIGENWAGQCSPPAGIGPLRAVAASSYVSLGIDVNGRLWGWGTTEAALLQFPPDLGSLQAIAASGHAVALRVDGTVRCWGLNGVGQCNVPPSAVGVSRVSASVEGSLVTKGTGEVLYWGSSSYGIQTIPADLGPVIVAQLGGSHAIALRADGVVRCWGSNGAGQCNVPLGTVDCVDVSAGAKHSVALRADGRVIAWGCAGGSDSGPCDVPDGLPRVRSLVQTIAGGTYLVLAPRCAPDLNDDAQVNGLDLGVMLGQWGPGSPAADLDEDGSVNGLDLGILLGAWGVCP
jgi:hypothetical protein